MIQALLNTLRTPLCFYNSVANAVWIVEIPPLVFRMHISARAVEFLPVFLLFSFFMCFCACANIKYLNVLMILIWVIILGV